MSVTPVSRTFSPYEIDKQCLYQRGQSGVFPVSVYSPALRRLHHALTVWSRYGLYLGNGGDVSDSRNSVLYLYLIDPVTSHYSIESRHSTLWSANSSILDGISPQLGRRNCEVLPFLIFGASKLHMSRMMESPLMWVSAYRGQPNKWGCLPWRQCYSEYINCTSCPGQYHDVFICPGRYNLFVVYLFFCRSNHFNVLACQKRSLQPKRRSP